jgi:nicotinate-nucleotide pyrophosphorylase (carboxylating)
MEKHMPSIFPPSVGLLIDAAFLEDFPSGDITSRLTIPQNFITGGRVIAKQDLIVSGADVFAYVLQRLAPETEVKLIAEPGQKTKTGTILAEVRGSVTALLVGERTALNFMQRLSGIATLTSKYVEKLPADSKVRITDTRKTTPGMRFLERRAVLDGGGFNHRSDLSGGVLIKENHVAAAGSIGEAVRLCKHGAPHPLKIEIEVRNEKEMTQAIEAGADSVLLDNMSIEELERCVATANGKIFLEASGGVTLESVAKIARTGIDAISVGALTHSPPASDITFLIDGA